MRRLTTWPALVLNVDDHLRAQVMDEILLLYSLLIYWGLKDEKRTDLELLRWVVFQLVTESADAVVISRAFVRTSRKLSFCSRAAESDLIAST